MARESKTQQIGKYQYTTVQLGATAGRKVFIRLAKLLGSGASSKEPIAGMLAALNDDDVTFLVDTFSAVTTVQLDGNRNPFLTGIFEEHFAGQMMEQLKWLAFCVEANFGNFMSELGLTTDALTQAAAKVKQSNSQSAQTGQSGDQSTKAGQP